MPETIATILTAETKQFQSEFSKARATIDSYHKAVMRVGAVLGGSAVLGAVVGKFNAIRNSIDLLNDQSARLQMPVEEMQRLNAVAEMSGASVEGLAKALNKSKLNAVEATKGSKGLNAEFAALGINAKEFLELNPTEQLVAIARGFNGAANQGAAFSAVFKIMGKGAADLIPLLRDGEAGIEAISRRLQVLGGEDVAAVAALNDEFDLLASNLDTKLKGSFLALRPVIEGTLQLLNNAADGIAVALDSAGGVGKSGGAMGGLQMLTEIERLESRIAGIKKAQASGGASDAAQLGMQMALRNSSAAVDVLKSRFEALSEEAKLSSRQLAEFDRLRKSGLGEDELQAAVASLNVRTEAGAASLKAEKDLATAAAETAQQLEKQEGHAKNIAKELGGLRDKVASRIFELQTPEVRRDSARSDLQSILKGENAASLDELRKRVGASKTDEERVKALKALDAGLDRMAQIKRATEELQAVEKQRSDSTLRGIDEELVRLKEREDLKEAGRKKDIASASARQEFSGEVAALKLELSGRKDLADRLRTETQIRSDVAGFAERMGISEERALVMLRERARAQEQLDAMRENEKLGGGKTLARRRGIRTLENGAGDFNAGNNMQDWRWRLRPGDSKIMARSPGIMINENVRNGELRRRAGERESMRRPSVDPNTRLLEKLSVAVEGLEKWASNIGTV